MSVPVPCSPGVLIMRELTQDETYTVTLSVLFTAIATVACTAFLCCPSNTALRRGYVQKPVQVENGKVEIIWILPEATPQPLEKAK